MSAEVMQFQCLTCLDCGHLPGIGPCPDCRPDEYAEHMLAWIDQHTNDAELGDVA